MRGWILGLCMGASSLWADDLVHFLLGDVVPLELQVGGDLLNLVGSSDMWLIVRQECWMDPAVPLFSWDGVNWLDFEQFVGGGLHCSMGATQATIALDVTRKT